MNCKEIQELLPAYEEKLLAAQEMDAVRNHLSGCSLCQKELQQLSAAWTLLGVLEPITPSAEFRTGFWEKVRREEEKRTSWLAFPRLVPALAGFLGVWVVGVGLGTFLFMHTKPSLAVMKSSSGWSDASLVTAYLKRVERI